MRRAWWQGTGATLAVADHDAVFGVLADELPFPLEDPQRAAWRFTIRHLAEVGSALPDAHLFLEFTIPRMGRRADAVVVLGGCVFVLEYKLGAARGDVAAREQVHGYALDLRHFHATSHAAPIVPVLIPTLAPQSDVPLGLWAPDRVHAPLVVAPADVTATLQRMAAGVDVPAVEPSAWAAGAYRPTPTIVEAAQALFRGHTVAEITRNEAGAENLTRTAAAIDAAVARARSGGGKVCLFMTGVPGAGKTLAGLNIACGGLDGAGGRDATFLSGNGPLVEVLREALKRDARRRKAGADPGDPEVRHVQAREADKFVQNVHHFRDEYVRSPGAPSEQIVIFDEAQRAWNAEMCADFMTRKKGADSWTQSEPAFLLSVMDRRPDWCAVVCLVGEGQEINRGEAGMGAWIDALSAMRGWRVVAAPRLGEREGGLSRERRAWIERFADVDAGLHLAVPVRSFRSDRVAAWVAAVLGEDAGMARANLPDPASFPIVRTRDLAAARAWVRARRRGTERSGMLAAAGGLRLRPEGLHVKARADVCSWFLNPPGDVRGSDALEEVGTEFDVQGLELDWCAVAWDLTLRRAAEGWGAWRFRGTGWQRVNDPDARAYATNAMRVLLTRARQGMVIFVPRGDAKDPTRPPAMYDAVAAWLAVCGVPELEQASNSG